jgi:molybdenum cofactor cytidylyltransferase
MAEVAIASVCHPNIIVLGANAERIKPEVETLAAKVIENPHWELGMSTSIRVGLETLNTINPKAEAVVLMLCDQPFVSTQLLNQLVENYRTTERPIVASEYASILGVPALFHCDLFPKLIGLSGDLGARQVIKHHLSESLGIPFPEGELDLDLPRDYERVLLDKW